MTRELLKQALDALEGVAQEEPINQDEMGGCVWCGGPGGYVAATGDPKDHDATCAWVIARKQIASIRAHLAKPQSEPVAWMTKDGRVANAHTVGTAMPTAPKASFYIPLYTHPSSTESEVQRPVNCGTGHCSCIECTVAQETCKWTEDDDGVWETTCGALWEFNWRGPAENGVKFCHGCGKSVEIVETP